MDNGQDGFSAGMPSESNLTPWIERLIGRSLGDMRIHDSTQAGVLAGRLGARAFAVGRDVYVRPELLRPLTPRSVALLAHELTHAAEQTGAAPVTDPGSSGLGLPHAPATFSGPSLSVQRETTGGAQGAEARAVAVEAAALQAMQQQPAAKGTAPLDPELVAEEVYRRLLRDLRIGQERGAHR